MSRSSQVIPAEAVKLVLIINKLVFLQISGLSSPT